MIVQWLTVVCHSKTNV